MKSGPQIRVVPEPRMGLIDLAYSRYIRGCQEGLSAHPEIKYTRRWHVVNFREELADGYNYIVWSGHPLRGLIGLLLRVAYWLSK